MNPDSSTHELIDELADEFVSRKQAGQDPTITEYCERYPALAVQIKEIFPTLELLQDARLSSVSVDEEMVEAIGDYRIIRRIGQGGMGVVYEAEQQSLGRRVALKVLSRRWSTSDRALTRFQREAQAAARMHHTNIVPVFDVGSDQGHFFYAMQLIEGMSLDKLPDDRSRLLGHSPSLPESDGSSRWEKDLSPSAADTERLTSGSGSETERRRFYDRIAEIGVQAADALHYAHSRGIVHRDVKPSNLLLDHSGTLWITDFGLAKVDSDSLTRSGDLLGTLHYMSPERFRGECDERADVYALGLTLYELLAGQPAFHSSDRLQLIGLINKSEPPSLRTLDPRVPRDLETIILKAIDKEPGSRYQSADELAGDLRRFLDDMPVAASRLSPTRRLVRWARRNRQLAGALLAIALLLTLVAAGSSVALFREAEHRAELETANNELETTNNELESTNSELETTNTDLQHKLYAYQIQRANVAYRDDSLDVLRSLLEECPEELRDWEWFRCMWLARPRKLLSIHGFERPLFTPDGRFLITAGPRGGPDSHAAIVWDSTTGERSGPLMSGTSNLTSLAISRDGKRLATGFISGTVVVWDFDARREVWSERAHTDKIDGMAFSPDGTRLASVSWDQTLKVFDAKTGELQYAVGPVGHRLRCADFSPSGEQIATACYQAGTASTAKVFSADDGRLLFELHGHADSTESIAFSPDGKHLLTGSVDRTVKLWDAASGAELKTYLGHAAKVGAVSFNPDGDQFASGSPDRTLRIRDVATGEELMRYQTGNPIAWLSYSNDGQRIATFGGLSIDVWESRGSSDVLRLRHGARVLDCAFSPDGRSIASCGPDGTVKIWDVATGKLLRSLHGHEANVNSVAWHPQGEVIASASSDQTARLWDARSGEPVATFHIPALRLFTAQFSPDGAQLACGTFSRSVWIFDVTSRKPIRKLLSETRLNGLTWSPDGRSLATGHADCVTTVWDLQTGQIARTLDAGEFAVAFTPDGKRLVAGCADGTVRLCDVLGSGETRVIGRHQGAVRTVAVSPNGRRIVSGGNDDSLVKIWDTVSGEELLSLRGHRSGVRAVSISSDGRTIASASADGTVAVWESTGSSAQWPIRRLASQASRIVDRLYDSHTFAADVLSELHADHDLEPDVRQLALEIAATRGDNALRLFRDSWSVTISPDGDVQAYDLARRKAAAACAVVPDSLAFRTALGVAQFRLGRYDEALESLNRAREGGITKHPVRYIRNAVVPKGVYPVSLAFLAMTLHQLDRDEDARSELERLHRILKDGQWGHYPDVSSAEQEAQQLIAGDD